MQTDGRTYQNPPDMKFLRMIASICMMCFLLGVVGFYLDGGSLLVLGGMWIIGAVFLFGIWWREYFHRPRVVETEKNGVRLVFRYSPQRFVNWKEIRWVDALAGDKSTALGRWQRDGIMQLTRGLPFPLNYEVAYAIRENYAIENGMLPPASNDWKKNSRV